MVLTVHMITDSVLAETAAVTAQGYGGDVTVSVVEDVRDIRLNRWSQ